MKVSFENIYTKDLSKKGRIQWKLWTKKMVFYILFFFALGFSFFSVAQNSRSDALSGFDEKNLIDEFFKKGYSENELQGYLEIKRKEYIERNHIAQNGLTEKNNEPPSPDQMAPCTNMDFETGNFSGWTGATGTFAGCCPNFGIIPGRHTIVTGPGLDPCGGFPVVAPGGSFSVKLGNNNTGAEAEQLMQTFTVTQPLFIYRYAVVLEDPAHAATDQPYFKVEVLDQLGQPLVCGNYSFVAGQGVPGFFNSATCPQVIYKPWTPVAVDLSLYMGLNVTVRFTTADCALSGHYGYAYIDGACLQSQITQSNTFCAGGSAQLCAPAGMATYNWTPGNLTTQCITVTSAGTYTVNMTTSSPCPLFPLTHTVTQYPSPVAGVSTTNSSCSGCNGSATANVNGGNSPYTYQWSPSGGTSATATGLCTGSYTLTVSTVDGCTDTSSFVINNSANFFASPGALTQPSCSGGNNGTATVNPSGGTLPYTYLWSTVPAQTTATATGLSAGSYTVDVYDNNGCMVQVQVTISQPSPVVILSSSQTNTSCNGICDGSAQINVAGGTSPYTYQWSNSQTTSSISNLCAGNYSVVVSDSSGCSIANSYTVTQPAVLVSSANGTNPNCSNGTGSATAMAGGGTPGYTYLWSTVPAQTTATATGLPSGNYTVIVSDVNGCTSTNTVTITVPSALSVSVSSTPATCGQNDGTATANPAGGTGSYTYSWNSSPVQNTATATGLSVGNYTVTVTDANGCAQTQTVTVTNTSGLNVTMSQTNILCNGLCAGSATANVTGGSSPYSYAWSSGQSTSAINNICAGTYTSVVTDNSGCTITQTVTITQPPVLTVSIFDSSATCGNSNGYAVAFVSGGTPSYAYLWSNGQTATTGVATGLSAGTYSVTVTDNNGCTTTGSVTITQTPAITLSVSATQSSCGSSNGTATATISGGTPAYSYLWNNGQTSSTATGLALGTYTVTVTDGNGCSQTGTVQVNNNGGLVITSSSSADPLCNGGTNGSASVVVSGTGLSYSWSPSGQNSSSATGLGAGSYTLVVTDVNGCTATQSFTLNQPSVITANTTVAPSSCNNNDGSATVIASGGIGTFSYLWSPGGQATPVITGLSSGVYSVLVTDANGCTQTATAAVGGTPGPSINAGADVTIIAGTNTNLNASGGGVTYSWSPSADLSCSNCSSPVAAPVQSTQYCVVATDSNGCSATDCMSVIVQTPCPENVELTLPSAFSPNGDGHNDFFVIAGLDNCVVKYSLIIFDRWGEKVYDSSDLQTAWDGTYHGKPMDTGVFVYYFSTIFTNGQSLIKKGNISLIR